MKQLKPYVSWVILGGTLFFVLKALKERWLEVAAIRIEATGWAVCAIALGITLLAHTWSGWVWTWLLDELAQPIPSPQFIQVYLKTNLAKYLPGNIWHYYGRILVAKNAGVAPSVAMLSVLLEPLLMAAAALIMVLVAIQPIAKNSSISFQLLPILGLVVVLMVIHPWCLNQVIRWLSAVKFKPSESPPHIFAVKRYLWRPLLGELIFIGLRGSGFLLTLQALTPLKLQQIPLLLGVFSFSWLLGLIVPTPGGLGVFEATAMTLLQDSFAPGISIAAIALYRLISILAETAGALLAWLDERRLNQNTEFRIQNSKSIR